MKSAEASKLIFKLRHLAIERGMTQEDIARATGLKQQAVSAVFSGNRDARISTITAIAGALGVTVTLKNKSR